MSLKVLLADDSAAIKKVVQLSLQDYGIVLKTVGSGKDVIDVAKSFQPDIAFVDVLLPQKTGYDVASELKKDDALKKIPVIMLWSSFMAFDDAKFKSSGAEDKLEKPFEVAGLRALITKYVPKTAASTIAKHFEFPTLYFDSQKAAMVEAPEPALTSAPPQVQTQAQASKSEEVPAAESWSMSSFEDVNDFSQASAEQKQNPPPEPLPEASNIWSGDSEWIRKDLGKFTVPIPDENLETADQAIASQYTNTNINLKEFLLKPHSTEEAPTAESPQAPAKMPEPAARQGAASPAFDENLAREIRAQAKEIIEKVVWKLVPDIASNMIKEELNRLLGDEK